MSVLQTNLIVNYIPQNFDEKALLNLFSEIGLVHSHRIMRDFKTGYSYGFGFVTYHSTEDAQKAIEQLNGLKIGNKRIKVSYARPSGEGIKDTNLYVTNIPRTFTEVDLENTFGKYGKIVQKNLLVDKITGLQRGVAFVRFDKREEAQQAICELDGQVLEGSSGPMSVRIAEEYGKQKAAFYAGWQAGLRQNHRHMQVLNNMGYGC